MGLGATTGSSCAPPPRRALLAPSPLARDETPAANIAAASDRILAYVVDLALCYSGWLLNRAIASALGFGLGVVSGPLLLTAGSVLQFWWNGGRTPGQAALGRATL